MKYMGIMISKFKLHSSGFSLGRLHIGGGGGATSAGGQVQGDIDLMGGGGLTLIDYIIN